jgi:hypothetical protein
MQEVDLIENLGYYLVTFHRYELDLIAMVNKTIEKENRVDVEDAVNKLWWSDLTKLRNNLEAFETDEHYIPPLIGMLVGRIDALISLMNYSNVIRI